MSSHRAQNLISRVPDHAEAPALRNAVSAVLAVAEKFQARRAKLAERGNLTSSGLQEALRESLLKEHARDLRDAQVPIREVRARLNTLKAGWPRWPPSVACPGLSPYA